MSQQLFAKTMKSTLVASASLNIVPRFPGSLTLSSNKPKFELFKFNSLIDLQTLYLAVAIMPCELTVPLILSNESPLKTNTLSSLYIGNVIRKDFRKKLLH